MVHVPQIDEQRTQGAGVDVESIAFLGRMAQLVPGIIYIFNHASMSNEYSNRSIAELLGYGSEEIKAMGDSLFERIIHPEDLERLVDHIAALKALGEKEHAVWEYRAITRTGKEVWLRSIDAVFSRCPDGSVLRHVGIAFDITAEKTAALRLLQLNSELEERVAQRTRELESLNNELESRVTRRTTELQSANRELEQISYVATHDLKVPINNMSSLTHMLSEARDLLPPEHVETLSWMRDVCDQASEKLEALVCVAQANTMPSGPFVAVNLEEAIERALVSLHYQIREARALVKMDLNTKSVFFLPQEVESILQALISNTLKYRSVDRRLSVRVSSFSENGMTIIRVADNGSGLDLPRDTPKVFGLFQRAHVAPHGEGVALYSIRRILERIGGSIDVKSGVEIGSTFTLQFPEPAKNTG